MSTDGFAEFARRMGHTVRQAAGVYWFDDHPHVYASFPFHQSVDPAQLVLTEVLGKDGWVLRYPCAFGYGRNSYRLICSTPDYNINCLSGKARNQTRRGLKLCTVRPLSFAELARDGPRLNSETLIRQGRRIAPDFSDYWQRYYRSAEQADGAHAWGAFLGSELAAYLIGFEMEDVAHVLIVRSSTQSLRSYPNNALLFEYLRRSLGTGTYRTVSIGLESIRQDLNSLDHFKYGMGFAAMPIGQRVELAPWLARLLRRPVLDMLMFMAPAWQHGEKLDKLAGLLTWYRAQLQR